MPDSRRQVAGHRKSLAMLKSTVEAFVTSAVHKRVLPKMRHHLTAEYGGSLDTPVDLARRVLAVLPAASRQGCVSAATSLARACLYCPTRRAPPLPHTHHTTHSSLAHSLPPAGVRKAGPRTKLAVITTTAAMQGSSGEPRSLFFFHSGSSCWPLFAHRVTPWSRYVLYNLVGNPDSLNYAKMKAWELDAMLLDTTIATPYAAALELTLVFDATKMTINDTLELAEGWPIRNFTVEQPPGPMMVDYAVYS